MLLEALVGCAGVTLRAVATAMGVTIRGGKVIAEGIWGRPRHPGGRSHRTGRVSEITVTSSSIAMRTKRNWSG